MISMCNNVWHRVGCHSSLLPRGRHTFVPLFASFFAVYDSAYLEWLSNPHPDGGHASVTELCWSADAPATPDHACIRKGGGFLVIVFLHDAIILARPCYCCQCFESCFYLVIRNIPVHLIASHRRLGLSA